MGIQARNENVKETENLKAASVEVYKEIVCSKNKLISMKKQDHEHTEEAEIENGPKITEVSPSEGSISCRPKILTLKVDTKLG